jgi:hypothetical protein
MIVIFLLPDLKQIKSILSKENRMSFKENLLKKIKIDQLARRVLTSMGSPDSGLKSP